MQCPSCGSHDVEWHDAGGDAVCVACGTVCEESTIVSSIEFSEAGGTATVVGQFVSENCSKPYSGAMHASARSRYGFMRNSRETTLAKGRASIAEVAGRLRLQNHYVESAHRLFAFAVQRNFVQGRKTMHVVAVCLYIKCREDKSPHMLIDFSDALSVNVFTLGSCFLKFCRLLNIETPLIDPSLYIHRFAGRMELGNKTQVVAQAALRVVARMKRDWIQTGRRPAGICAAALLIAARTHGFPRTQAEIVKVLRVCGMTVRTRLEEFEATPAAQLTMDELRCAENATTEDESDEIAQDPPSFSRGRLPIGSTASNVELLKGDGAPLSTAIVSCVSSPPAPSTLVVATTMPSDGAAVEIVPGGRPKRKQSQSAQRRERERTALYKDVEEQLQKQVRNQIPDGDGSSECRGKRKVSREESAEVDDEDRSDYKERGNVGSEEEPRTSSNREGSTLAAPSRKKLRLKVGRLNTKRNKTEEENALDTDDDNSDDDDDGGGGGDDADDENFSDLDDDELSGFILNGEEAAKKAAIWTEMNRQYLQDRAVKEKKAAEDLRKAESSGIESKKRKKRQYTKSTVQNTAEEALEQTIVQKKISKKINYEALAGIFNSSGDLASSLSRTSTSSTCIAVGSAPMSRNSSRSCDVSEFSSCSFSSSAFSSKPLRAPTAPWSRSRLPRTVENREVDAFEEITEDHAVAPTVVLPSALLAPASTYCSSLRNIHLEVEEPTELEEEYSPAAGECLPEGLDYGGEDFVDGDVQETDWT